jgi:hypothetical protein
MVERVAVNHLMKVRFFPVELKMSKKSIRAYFRKEVFKRDNFCCRCCGIPGYDRQCDPQPNRVALDAHHITDRHNIENGGYVKENGISVCDDCHIKAENCSDGFSPAELYMMIGSSEEKAREASK